jgi:hypothetical protein
LDYDAKSEPPYLATTHGLHILEKQYVDHWPWRQKPKRCVYVATQKGHIKLVRWRKFSSIHVPSKLICQYKNKND